MVIQDHRRIRERMEYLVNGKWCPAAKIKNKVAINEYMRNLR